MAMSVARIDGGVVKRRKNPHRYRKEKEISFVSCLGHQ